MPLQVGAADMTSDYQGSAFDFYDRPDMQSRQHLAERIFPAELVSQLKVGAARERAIGWIGGWRCHIRRQQFHAALGVSCSTSLLKRLSSAACTELKCT